MICSDLTAGATQAILTIILACASGDEVIVLSCATTAMQNRTSNWLPEALSSVDRLNVCPILRSYSLKHHHRQLQPERHGLDPQPEMLQPRPAPPISDDPPCARFYDSYGAPHPSSSFKGRSHHVTG
jgi:hypothetical protein